MAWGVIGEKEQGRSASISVVKEDYNQLQQNLKMKELELEKAKREIKVQSHTNKHMHKHTHTQTQKHTHVHVPSLPSLQEAQKMRWTPPNIDDTINRLLTGQVGGVTPSVVHATLVCVCADLLPGVVQVTGREGSVVACRCTNRRWQLHHCCPHLSEEDCRTRY